MGVEIISNGKTTEMKFTYAIIYMIDTKIV